MISQECLKALWNSEPVLCRADKKDPWIEIQLMLGEGQLGFVTWWQPSNKTGPSDAGWNHWMVLNSLLNCEWKLKQAHEG